MPKGPLSNRAKRLAHAVIMSDLSKVIVFDRHPSGGLRGWRPTKLWAVGSRVYANSFDSFGTVTMRVIDAKVNID